MEEAGLEPHCSCLCICLPLQAGTLWAQSVAFHLSPPTPSRARAWMEPRCSGHVTWEGVSVSMKGSGGLGASRHLEKEQDWGDR